LAWTRGLFVFVLGFAAARFVLPTFYPFVLGFLVAGLIRPAAGLLERRGVPHGAATLMAVLALCVIGTAACALMVGALFAESASLLRGLPVYYTEARQALAALFQALGLAGPGQLPDTSAEGALGPVFRGASAVLGALAHGALALPELALGMVVAVITGYFLARDAEAIARAIERSVPAALVRWGTTTGRSFTRAVLGYLKAQFLLVGATSLLTTTGLWLMGEPYAVVLGLTAGVIDLVPLLGASTILLPWGAYLILTGHVMHGVRLLGLLVVVAGTREIVEMRVVGGQVGLHPVAALCAMYLGVMLFGPAGVALGPILVAASWAVARQEQV